MTIFSQATELLENNIPFCLVTLIGASGRYQNLIGRKCLIVEDENGTVKPVTAFRKKSEELEGVFNDMAVKLAKDCLANQQLMHKTLVMDDGELTLFVEPIISDPELVILGAGHIARPLAKMAKMLDYKITVYDDRPDFANQKYFPEVDKIICDSFTNISAYNIIKSNSIVVVVTRGHQHDLTCLNQLIGKKLTYLGMIGSRRRSLEVRQLLISQGFTQEAVDFLHAPIGLDIGADTPEEISISILAEITKERRKLWQKGNLLAIDKQTFVGTTDRGAYHVLKHLAEVAGSELAEPVVLATIVKTIGSTPRKAGAKMVINSIGQATGTIGGGCAEAEVKVKALDVLLSKKPTLVKVNMNNDVAGDEGMVCGGNMEVFVESISIEVDGDES